MVEFVVLRGGGAGRRRESITLSFVLGTRYLATGGIIDCDTLYAAYMACAAGKLCTDPSVALFWSSKVGTQITNLLFSERGTGLREIK